jgi:2-methylisocitrate lyase-like PEP mutase family enzyme
VTQREKAERLRALHHASGPLVLANAWDVASALILQAAGFPAIATSSAGVAYSLGYPDGERIPRGQMLAAVTRIARAVSVPLSADMEAGYGETPEEMAETARELLASGAVGLNIEDGIESGTPRLREKTPQVEKIRALRETATAAGVPLVINARTDGYMLGLGDAGKQFDETVARGRAYREAGADCIFVIGLKDPAIIGKIVKAIGWPINILAGPGSPSIPELKKLGVVRVSLGSGAMRASLSALRRIAEELKTTGTYTELDRGGALIPHSEMEELLSKAQVQ